MDLVDTVLEWVRAFGVLVAPASRSGEVLVLWLPSPDESSNLVRDVGLALAAPIVAGLVGFLAWRNGRDNLIQQKAAIIAAEDREGRSLKAAGDRQDAALDHDRQSREWALRHRQLARVTAAMSEVDALMEGFTDDERSVTVDDVQAALERLRGANAELQLVLPVDAAITFDVTVAIGQIESPIYEARTMNDDDKIAEMWVIARENFEGSLHTFNAAAALIVAGKAPKLREGGLPI